MFNSKKINDLECQVELIRVQLQLIQDTLKENKINKRCPGILFNHPSSLIGQKVNAILEFLKVDAKEEHSASRVVLTKRKTQ